MSRIALAVASATLVATVVSSQTLSKSGDGEKHVKQQRPPSGLILGRVVDAATNQPVVGAVVSLGRDGARGAGSSTTVLATDGGYFVFRDVPAGTVTIAATAAGYLPGGLGQRRIGGPNQPTTVGDGARANVSIRLWREATLAGTITDETGDPVAGINVALLSRDALGRAPGASRSIGSITEPYTRTDASGAYRFTGLVPGDYIVAVPSRLTQLPATFAGADSAALDALRTSGLTMNSGARGLGTMLRLGDTLVQPSGDSLASQLPMTLRADGTVVAYAPTFFAGTSRIDQAERITLASGDDRHSVNLRLTPSVLRQVRGRLTGPAGPIAGMAVHLLPAFASDSVLERTYEAGITVSTGDGSFAFAAVPPGDYVLKAWRLPQALVIGTDATAAEPTLWASVPVTVTERGVADVAVTLKAGSVIRGRLVQEGTAAAAPPARYQTFLSVAFEPPWVLAFGARLATRVTPALEFSTQGLPPGRYAPVLPNQFLAPAAGWYFESATQSGRDLMLSPLVLEPGTDVTDVVITLADRRTTLTGVINDAQGRPHPTGAVVVFPADTRTWIDSGLPPLASFSAAASQTGTFSLDVRPGDYLVSAIDEARLSDWRRDATIRALAAQATRLRIVRGENPRQELRVVAIRAQTP
ncbi:MAG TPA: carboxypeptidase-like regulatory domain-containing protein [Vicinamibacterales bacterium]|nr:carboxypeptidase-like regulatory domain-containing protein [Vicinamibacterales bacterium]